MYAGKSTPLSNQVSWVSKRLALGSSPRLLAGELRRQRTNYEMHHTDDLKTDDAEQCRHEVWGIEVVRHRRVIDKGAGRNEE